MQINRFARRLAVATTSVAVAGTALVGATMSTAQAATVTNDYTCAAGPINAGTFTLSVTGDIPVPEYWAGAGVPAGLLNVTASATVPPEAAGLLTAAGIERAESPDFGFTLGTSKAPVPLAGDFVTQDGTTTWNATGKNSAFQTPKPGAYDVLLPTVFSLATKTATADSVTLTCTIVEGSTPAAVDTITLNQQSVKEFKAKGATVKKGKKATVKVTSLQADAGAVNAGKVTAFKGKKKVGSANVKNGKASIKIAKLPVGKNKLTLKYGNNPSVKAATAKVTVTVKKK
ncbi:hypothetical protein G6553_16565 [Nocardioides sp. IC4_145]|uniref:Ig-like domain repeat protein n=1 Tax=Nocardioides sp. IC4_145 TaxID=2714037 RepID=UPI0014084AF8|nr:Ig-like domain repeat protein [Nocardioides sp. IC4_145]NHC24780.1 hypothetical protein [Nocardioides sp. IC4_145]